MVIRVIWLASPWRTAGRQPDCHSIRHQTQSRAKSPEAEAPPPGPCGESGRAARRAGRVRTARRRRSLAVMTISTSSALPRRADHCLWLHGEPIGMTTSDHAASRLGLGPCGRGRHHSVPVRPPCGESAANSLTVSQPQTP